MNFLLAGAPPGGPIFGQAVYSDAGVGANYTGQLNAHHLDDGACIDIRTVASVPDVKRADVLHAKIPSERDDYPWFPSRDENTDFTGDRQNACPCTLATKTKAEEHAAEASIRPAEVSTNITNRKKPERYRDGKG